MLCIVYLHTSVYSCVCMDITAEMVQQTGRTCRLCNQKMFRIFYDPEFFHLFGGVYYCVNRECPSCGVLTVGMGTNKGEVKDETEYIDT